MRIPEMNLSSNSDRVAYIIEASRMIAKIAKEAGIKISIISSDDGSVVTCFGEYTYSNLKECGESCDYMPKGGKGEWRSVMPDQINLGGKPCSKDT